MAQNDDGIPAEPKAVRFVASSRRDMQKLPKSVRLVFGQALLDAQYGKKHPDAKPLKGFGGADYAEYNAQQSKSEESHN